MKRFATQTSKNRALTTSTAGLLVSVIVLAGHLGIATSTFGAGQVDRRDITTGRVVFTHKLPQSEGYVDTTQCRDYQRRQLALRVDDLRRPGGMVRFACSRICQ